MALKILSLALLLSAAFAKQYTLRDKNTAINTLAQDARQAYEMPQLHAHSRRQFPALDSVLESLTQTVKSLSDPVKPVKRVEVAPSGNREGAKKVKLYYGPFNLPKKGDKPIGFGGMDRNSNSWSFYADFPTNVTLLFTDHHFEYPNGRRADASNGIYDHHLYHVDFSKKPAPLLTCPGDYGAFFPHLYVPGIMTDSSEDKTTQYFTTADGKFDSGFYIAPGDKILHGAEVLNYNNEAKSVYVVSELEYLEGKPKGFMETMFQPMTVAGCDWNNALSMGGYIYAPKGQTKFSIKSPEQISTRDGYIVHISGHLHDGGTNMMLKINGRVVCDSRAEYGKGSGGHHDMGSQMDSSARNGSNIGAGADYIGITGMTVCTKAIKVSKNDKFTVEAYYDLEKHPPRIKPTGEVAEEMAIFSVFFASDLPL